MANVRLAIDTGVAALSIQDTVGPEFLDLHEAVASIEVSRDATVASGAEVLLVGRSNGFLRGHASVDDTMERLVAYSATGADVLCAAGISDLAIIKAVVEAVAPKPIDVQLANPGIRAAVLGERGVRRISVGDCFAAACWSGFERAAQQFIDFGDLLPESCSTTERTA
jgi:2-methylisocitrate lyase-like PEP mutase family enzyme